MHPLLIVTILAVTTLAGDYLIKLSSQHPGGLTSHHFLLGALFYALPAVGWFVLMRSHSLAALGVYYSVSTLVMMALLGFFVFGERLSGRDLIGLALGIAAVVVMTRGES